MSEQVSHPTEAGVKCLCIDETATGANQPTKAESTLELFFDLGPNAKNLRQFWDEWHSQQKQKEQALRRLERKLKKEMVSSDRVRLNEAIREKRRELRDLELAVTCQSGCESGIKRQKVIRERHGWDKLITPEPTTNGIFQKSN
jgi:hypothetical protein